MSNTIDLRNLAAGVQQALQNSNFAAQQARGTHQQVLELAKNAQQLAQTMAMMSASRTGGNPSLQYVENVPGRRIPYDALVAIPIGANVQAEQQGTITINQDGPFVAVARYAFFLSQFQFQYINPSTQAVSTFQGRSYGRWRPVHSAWDLYDGVPRSEVVQAVPAPGGGAPHIISPSNASSFRSMQPDFMIQEQNDGYSQPRSNIYVPSPAWTNQINSPFNLGALDFFERGEVITFKVQPQHPNNPSYGNVNGFTGDNDAWPFVQSGFDAVEGVSDPALQDTDVDPVTRLPNGILYIGLHGYKIIQPPGAGPY